MALTYTTELGLGFNAPDFNLPDVVTGSNKNLNELKGEKGTVVAFICNHCPYVQRIAERLAADTHTLMQEGVNVLAVMSNDYQNYPQDAPDKMLQFAKQHNFQFPYLIDEDQAVAKAYGAVCTPDFFGLNKSGELQYRGRLDSLAAAPMGSDREPELLNAMRQIAATGKGPEEQIASMGCSIKWKA